MVEKESVSELTASEFSGFIKKNKLAIVDFYAEWCMPCVMMAPIFESIAEKQKKAVFGKINVDEAEELAREYDATSIPCIVFFKDGKEVDRIVGSVNEEVIEEKIKLFL
jgi:thioredoxin 1